MQIYSLAHEQKGGKMAITQGCFGQSKFLAL